MSEGDDYLNSMFALCVACIWANQCTISEGRGIASTQCSYCVLHAIKQYLGTICEAKVLSNLIVCIVFCTHLSEFRVPSVRPRHCLNSVFVLCFARIWVSSGYRKWGRRIVSTQCFGCLDSMFALCFTRIWVNQGAMGEAEFLSQLNVCIVFYTHLSDARVPQVMPRDCLNSMFVLCFTRIWATPG